MENLAFIPGGIATPALVFHYDRILENLKNAIRIAENPNRLRLHIKTHKSPDICRMLVTQGISRVKCATLKEAEVAAQSGLTDILIAYQLTLEQVKRLSVLIKKYTGCRFSVLIDNPHSLRVLSDVIDRKDQSSVGIYIDINLGQNRCGVAVYHLVDLCQPLSESGFIFAGIHGYDGHIHDSNLIVRQEKAQICINIVEESIKIVTNRGLNVEDVVIGGSPAFAIYAELTDWSLSPGTVLLWDHGYGDAFPELPFKVAAFLIGHIISKPAESLITLDLGTKALSCDGAGSPGVVMAMNNEVEGFREANEYDPIAQSEEHWVLRTERKHSVGDSFFVLPEHICTTVNLYDEALVIKDSEIEVWKIETSRKTSWE